MRQPHRARSEFLLFSMVGVAGFLVDSGVLYLVRFLLGLDPYLGRVISYVAAATTTWRLNRRFTFPHADARLPHRQWAKFLISNAVGGLVNYGVYAAIVSSVSHTVATLTMAVAAGSLSGLGFNFFASRAFVFTRAWEDGDPGSAAGSDPPVSPGGGRMANGNVPARKSHQLPGCW